jgi:hypothetical protein
LRIGTAILLSSGISTTGCRRNPIVLPCHTGRW